MSAEEPKHPQSPRDLAVERIKRRRKFVGEAIVYLLVNAGLWIFWATDDGSGTDEVWPVLVSGIWGAFLALDAWKAFGERPISEREIDEEMRRLGR